MRQLALDHLITTMQLHEGTRRLTPNCRGKNMYFVYFLFPRTRKRDMKDKEKNASEMCIYKRSYSNALFCSASKSNNKSGEKNV